MYVLVGVYHCSDRDGVPSRSRHILPTRDARDCVPGNGSGRGARLPCVETLVGALIVGRLNTWCPRHCDVDGNYWVLAYFLRTADCRVFAKLPNALRSKTRNRVEYLQSLATPNKRVQPTAASGRG